MPSLIDAFHTYFNDFKITEKSKRNKTHKKYTLFKQTKHKMFKELVVDALADSEMSRA